MIRAVMHRDASGAYTGFTCSGHSGYAQAGADIVCAGVSALTITCVNALEAEAGVVPRVKTQEASGYLQAMLPPTLSDPQRHDAQLLLRATYRGLRDLAESYPDYLQVSIDDRRERS